MLIPEGLLADDQLYVIEYRLYGDPSAPTEAVDVSLLDVTPHIRGPEIVVQTASGDLADGSLDFGADTGSTTTAIVSIANATNITLNVASVELIGSGYALVNPQPSALAILTEYPVEYEVRLLDPTQSASAMLRIVSDDPNRPTLDLALEYDGTTTLTTPPPIVDPIPGPLDPALDPIADQVVQEGIPLAVQIVASDPTPGDGLVYSVVRSPAFVSIDATTGLMTWSPPEDFYGGIYSFTVRAEEPSDPLRFHERSFEVTYLKSNAAPTFAPVASQQVAQGDLLVVSVGASDVDFPVQQLSYSLGPGAPAGATVDPTSGRFEWIPSETTPAGTYQIPIHVTDNGLPPEAAVVMLEVEVVEVNSFPIFDLIPNASIDEGEELTFTVNATDVDGDLPTYRLGANAPAGASIDPQTGDFAWTPGEEDGGRLFTLSIEAVDGVDPALVGRQTVAITVVEVNNPLVITLPDSLEAEVGTDIEFDVVFTETDTRPSGVPFYNSYNLVNPPTGATISSDGRFSWRPDTVGEFPVTILVNDYSGLPWLEVLQTITINVVPETVPPEIFLNLPTAFNAPFVFGSVKDNIALDQFEARFVTPSATDYVDLTPFIDGDFFTLTMVDLEGILGEVFVEGDYAIEFKATDVYGNIATKQLAFTVDQTPPDPATIELALASDTAPIGDNATTLDVVDLVAQTEPGATLTLILDSGESMEATANSSGEVVFVGVPLNLGRNPLYCTVADTAGNRTDFFSYVTRLTVDGSLGPDLFGYRAQAVTPTFDDISTTGQVLISFGSDGGALTLAELGDFSFAFYGNTYTELFVSAYGLISFGEADTYPPSFYDGVYLPDYLSIAPFWSYAEIPNTPSGGVYWELRDIVGGQQLILQWNTESTIYTYEVDEEGYDITLADPLSFQVILDSSDNSIQYNYLDLIGSDAADPYSAARAEAWQQAFAGTSMGGGYLLYDRSELGLPLALGNAPFDLVMEGASTRIAPTPGALPPVLHSEFTGYVETTEDEVGFALSLEISGIVLDADGIAELRGGFDLPNPGAFVDLLPLVATDGTFVLDETLLEQIYGESIPDGLYTFYLTATDNNGLTSTTSVPFNLDRDPPALYSFDLHEISDSLPLGDLVTDRKDVLFKGQTEPFYLVRVYKDINFAVSTQADETGAFVFEDFLYGLDLGDNTLTVEVSSPREISSSEYTITRVEGDGSVGPDAYGYWARSTTPSFVDIKTSGASILAGEDDAAVVLTASDLEGFDFCLYGATYNEIGISSNGGLTFGDVEYVNSFGPIQTNPETAAIAPFGFDLVVTPSSGVYWEVQDTVDDKQLIVQWDNVYSYYGDGPFTFQVILSMADASIQFNYGELGANDDWLFYQDSIGIKDAGYQSVAGRSLSLTPYAPYGEPTELVHSGQSVLIAADFPNPGTPRITSAEATKGPYLSGILLHFDRPMDRSSFSIADDLASFQGPAGDLMSQITSSRWLDSQTLQVNMAPQAEDGAYTLVLNSSIQEPIDGLGLDQDADGTTGEPVDDRYTATILLDRCTDPDGAGYQACTVDYEAIDLELGMPGVFVIVDDTDDGFSYVDLGTNTFRFYDTVASGDNSMFVSANGLITFGNGNPDHRPSDLSRRSATSNNCPPLGRLAD